MLNRVRTAVVAACRLPSLPLTAAMKRRTTPATVIASIALFFSLTGAGMAATGYRITSLWQIAPKVRHELRGSQGPVGPGGAAGPQGPAGTVSWSQSYIVGTAATLTTAQPKVEIVTQCHPGDQVVSGGYSGANEIVTADHQVSAVALDGPGWEIIAHLDPNAPSEAEAYVRDEAFCAPS